MGSLAKRIAAQRVYFDGDRTKPLAFRLAMLGRLETLIREQEDAVLAALRQRTMCTESPTAWC